MTRFTLVVVPAGGAILTCAEPLPPELIERIRGEFAKWKDGEYPVGIIADCDVVQVAEIDLDLAAAS